MVMKLLSKNMNERYQSAAALEADLRSSLAMWERSGRIDSFELGVHDVYTDLWYPRKLYGRARDLDYLSDVLDAGLKGARPHAILISGDAGVGKSTLVEQLRCREPLRGARYVAAKCDALNRVLPYGALVDIFQSLVRQMLGDDEVALRGWRERLTQALGSQASILFSLVPELELIAEPSPVYPNSSPQDAQGLFQKVIRQFVGIFCSQDRPLAIFLDDLQWLDSDSFALISHVMSSVEVQHLIFIGAYRRDEVGEDHPLRLLCTAIHAAGGQLSEMTVDPLDPLLVKCLLADSLGDSAQHVAPLAEYVSEKTGGNPLFTLQLLSELTRERLIQFDPQLARWSWDLPRIRVSQERREDIADLVIEKCNRLPLELRDAMKQMACLGYNASLAALCKIRDEPAETVEALFRNLALNGIVMSVEDGYSFCHDRIYEAAYELTPVAEKPAVHLGIGRALLGSRNIAELNDEIFDIAEQFGRGASAIESPGDKEWAANLNLSAARRAMSTVAYASALSILKAAEAHLGDRTQERNNRLVFDVELCRADCWLAMSIMPAHG